MNENFPNKNEAFNKSSSVLSSTITNFIESLQKKIGASELQYFQQDLETISSNIDIEILGATISITANEKPEYLEKILEKYKTAIANTHKISQIEEPLKVAILTGFLLCDALFKQK